MCDGASTLRIKVKSQVSLILGIFHLINVKGKLLNFQIILLKIIKEVE